MVVVLASRAERGTNFHLAGARGLARAPGGSVPATTLPPSYFLEQSIEGAQRAVTSDDRRLIRFSGFGASELANGIFRRPGEGDFRKGWEEIGSGLEEAVACGDYASLARCTQYAHFTPEYIVRAIWARIAVARFSRRPRIGARCWHRLCSRH